MLSIYDYLVIAFYFVFFVAVGYAFRKAGRSSSEFFRGGGQMSWWLVGVMGFMGSFSAWTFTGGAGVAYGVGAVVLVIYFGNALAFFSNAFWLAPRFRQMRVITIMEAVRERLGPKNEQFFTWINIPLQILGGGLWLYGLAIFCAPVFGLNIVMTIFLCGLVVSCVAAIGGAWAVATSDFLQTLMLLPITIVVAVYCLMATGGVGGLVERIPPQALDITASDVSGFGILWVVASLIERMVSYNTLQGGSRYLAVKNGKEARMAALLAGALFVGGALLWFVPPLAARALEVDLEQMFPDLAVAGEGAYVAMAIRFLPNGLLGLMVTGMLAATMSSMNESLNRNAGIFVRSFYRPVLRPTAGDREQVWVGRMVTMGFGTLCVLIALFYVSLKGMGIFELMLTFTAMLVIPMMVPMFWCLVVRRGPDWGAWVTVLVVMSGSILLNCLESIPVAVRAMEAMGISSVLGVIAENRYIVLTIGNFISGSVIYLLIAFLFKNKGREREKAVRAFFNTMAVPLSADEEGEDSLIRFMNRRIGKMALCYAAFVALLLLIPNNIGGRLAILFCAAFIGIVGGIILLVSKERKPMPG